MPYGDESVHNPLVYLIILNWNGLNDTLECLESVFAVDYQNFKAVVVDNGSTENPCATIKVQFPEAVFIENNENLGFAEGNNVGIRHALQQGADYILLLNNDTTVDPQLLTELVRASQELNDRAILGAQIYYYSEPDKVWYAGAEWDPLHSAFRHIKNELSQNIIEETDYVCGCALFFNVKIIEQTGLLDHRFFLTFEETDLCYRARRTGIRSYCVANAKVYHKISASFGGSASYLISYFLTRNSLLWGERNLPLKGYLNLIITTFRRIVWMSYPETEFKCRLTKILYVFKQHFRGKYSSVASYAHFLGFKDYLLRKFGNCPPTVSILLTSGAQGNESANI